MTRQFDDVDCPLCRADPRVENCPLCQGRPIDAAVAALYRVGGLEACDAADFYLFIRLNRLNTDDLPAHVHLVMHGITGIADDNDPYDPYTTTAAEVIEARFRDFWQQDWRGARVSYDPLKNVVTVSPDTTHVGRPYAGPRIITKPTGSQRKANRGTLTNRFPTGDPDRHIARTLRGPRDQRAKQARYHPKRPFSQHKWAK